MQRYGVAAGVAVVVLMFVLASITMAMRRQVHEARYGNQEIGPWDVRSVNNLFGQCGIWGFHKQLYRRSRLRAAVWVVLAAMLVCAALVSG